MASTSRPARRGGLAFGLSSRLLGLTILFVLLVEALVFLPSAANYRANWIETRVEQARLAALALDAAPMREVSHELANALLMRAEVLSVAEVRDGMRQQLLSQDDLPEGVVVPAETDRLRSMNAIGHTLGALFGQSDRYMLIIDPSRDADHLEILVPLKPLKRDLEGFGLRIIGLSLIIALAVGGLIFLSLYFLVVRPILAITASVEQFRDNPRDWTRRVPATDRTDEIGRAQNALSDMETAVQSAFRQRERLARLGEAMAKINHDLRNSLAAAQLVSDGLSASDDPRVQRAAPRLERALERAINLAQATLAYGKGEEIAVSIQDIELKPCLLEAASEGMTAHGDISLMLDVADEQRVRADRDSLHRIIVNLTRNAAQAMAAAGTPDARITLRAHAPRGGRRLSLDLADNGPGIPDRIRARLFQPFAVSGSATGSGLGLAIARELAEGMEAQLELVATGPGGTLFRLELPLA